MFHTGGALNTWKRCKESAVCFSSVLAQQGTHPSVHCTSMVYLPNWKHLLVNSKTSYISCTSCLCSKTHYTQTFYSVLRSPGFLWPIFQSLLIITLPLLGTMSFCGCICLMIQVSFLWLAWAGRGKLALNTCRWHFFSVALS